MREKDRDIIRDIDSRIHYLHRRVDLVMDRIAKVEVERHTPPYRLEPRCLKSGAQEEKLSEFDRDLQKSWNKAHAVSHMLMGKELDMAEAAFKSKHYTKCSYCGDWVYPGDYHCCPCVR
jgi:hypothetical protein